ncbi:maleylpyruvate isomerase N-terminal domain-containing protein [Streptomyces sp. NPDC002073]|uniref:maleylpyruvate isomerase N-terminal domain-containing protein n=1 Tax=Streptomyces sp. NBC_00239 TaxID=2903640 RepID=UPI002E292398|nr:maleylpyruvate isomerase N-terminal domain-containing protein [Streptomyces sp. NBC_00239]
MTTNDTTAQMTAADDLDRSVRLALDVLGGAPADAWDGRAGTLEWDCWETVEHLADDLFAYAAQLGPAAPPTDREVPFVYAARRPGGPRNTIHAERAAGVAGLLQVLESCGALLSAMVRTKGPEVRAHHVFGASDPAGFAAMGVVETLVHTYDLTRGLGLPWAPPEDVCGRALARLFPDAPAGVPAWTALLWCTGRTDLPALPRPTRWRWHGEPRP